MNYQKHYDLLMGRARNRILDIYTESHHIIPDCFYINRKRKGRKGWLEGNPDSPENLVELTPEEHHAAHLLLVKIYPHNHSLIKAAVAMTMDHNGKRINNKLFGWLKRLHSISQAEAMNGNTRAKGNTSGKALKGRKNPDQAKRMIGNTYSKGNKGNTGGKNPGHSTSLIGNTYGRANKGKPWSIARRDAQNKRRESKHD